MFSRLKTCISKLLKKAWHSLSQSHPVPGTRMAAADVAQSAEEDLKLDSLAREFSRELFAQLLLELPAYRNHMAQAYNEGNYQDLADTVHRVLGAAVYCDSGEMESRLRELRVALKSEDPPTIHMYFVRAMEAVDATLHSSGFR